MAKSPKASFAETRSAAISIRVKPSLHANLKAAAEKDGRTLAQYVERVLEMHLREFKKSG